MLTAIREEFRENEDLPNTTNPDDWAKIAGKKGERIVHIKPLVAEVKAPLRETQRVVPTGSTSLRGTPHPVAVLLDVIAVGSLLQLAEQFLQWREPESRWTRGRERG